MKIHELITADSWTKGFMAADSQNHCVEIDSKSAVKWCLLGWQRKVYPESFWDVYKKINAFLNINSSSDWNDSRDRTFSEVLAVLKKLDL
jgi:hypothetical protein